MKFLILTGSFKDAMSKMEKALPAKPTLPVLSEVMLKVERGECIFHATNLEQYVKTRVQCDNIDADGSFIIGNTKSLIKAMKFFKADYVSFETRENQVTIKCGDKTATIATINSDMKKYTYTAKKLAERFKLIKYAVADNEIKPILTGVHFNETDMVALNNYIMSINKDDALNIETPFTLSGKALQLCDNILKGNISFGCDKKYFVVDDEDTTIISRVFEGEYYKYKNFIPKHTNMLNVPTDNFVENLKYLKTFTDKAAKQIYIAWNGNRLRFYGDSGRYEALLNMDGDFDFTIGFDVDNMLNCLTQFNDTVDVYMGSSVTAILIKDENNTAIVMPVRLKNNPFAEVA